MKRLTVLDLTVIAVIITALAGFGLAKAGYAGVNQIIEGTHKSKYQCISDRFENFGP